MNPPDGWWIRIRLLGSARRLPGAPRQHQRAHRHRDPVTDRLHIQANELHRVVDRHPGVDRPARGVDVKVDVLVGIVGLQVDELGDDQVGRFLIDLPPEEHDTVVEQVGIDVERTLAAGGLLYDHRNEWHEASYRSGKAQSLGWVIHLAQDVASGAAVGGGDRGDSAGAREAWAGDRSDAG